MFYLTTHSTHFIYGYMASGGLMLNKCIQVALLHRGNSVDVAPWSDGSSDRSFIVDPLNYFSFQPVLHDWCSKGRGKCYPVCGVMHIK